MKIFLFFLLFSFSIFSLNSQVSVNRIYEKSNTTKSNQLGKFSPNGDNVVLLKDTIYVTNTAENQTDLHIQMKNEGSETKNIYWIVGKPYFNSAWESQVCDNNDLCYAFNVDKAPKASTVKSGNTEELKISFFYNNVSDTALVVLKIYDDKEFTNQIDSLIIIFDIGYSSSTNYTDNSDINISPNPTSNFFYLTPDKNISKVEIFNLVGKRIKTIRNINSNAYNVSGLRNGIYLVRVFDNNSKVLKVMKLSINKMRP